MTAISVSAFPVSKRERERWVERDGERRQRERGRGYAGTGVNYGEEEEKNSGRKWSAKMGRKLDLTSKEKGW